MLLCKTWKMRSIVFFGCIHFAPLSTDTYQSTNNKFESVYLSPNNSIMRSKLQLIVNQLEMKISTISYIQRSNEVRCNFRMSTAGIKASVEAWHDFAGLRCRRGKGKENKRIVPNKVIIEWRRSEKKRFVGLASIP